jgi:hypothetical protein
MIDQSTFVLESTKMNRFPTLIDNVEERRNPNPNPIVPYLI